MTLVAIPFPGEPPLADAMSSPDITLQEDRRLARRRRARRLLRKLPRRSNIARYPGLRWMARWTQQHPSLWSYRAPFTTRAYYIGSIVTFLPIMGGQILIGTALAILMRANLTIVAALQFVSNPLTGPLMYYASYRTGGLISSALGIGELGLAGAIATNLTLGGIVLGTLLGATLDVLDRCLRQRAPRAALAIS